MGKKTKIHKRIDGKLYQMNKSFRDLKMKQREKINGWLYEEYKDFVEKNKRIPNEMEDFEITENVLDKISAANIWIPGYEIENYYESKKTHFSKRLENEKRLKFKSYVDFYKSIIDQDKASIVICNLEHEIIYMNPAAIEAYNKRGGEQLIGMNLLDCHNEASKVKIKQIVEWFKEHKLHNIVYTGYNEKNKRDVYVVALREEDKLIGYYEKHEYRGCETMKPYYLW